VVVEQVLVKIMEVLVHMVVEMVVEIRQVNLLVRQILEEEEEEEDYKINLTVVMKILDVLY
jgi:hypothetical protein